MKIKVLIATLLVSIATMGSTAYAKDLFVDGAGEGVFSTASNSLHWIDAGNFEWFDKVSGDLKTPSDAVVTIDLHDGKSKIKFNAKCVAKRQLTYTNSIVCTLKHVSTSSVISSVNILANTSKGISIGVTTDNYWFEYNINSNNTLKQEFRRHIYK